MKNGSCNSYAGAAALATAYGSFMYSCTRRACVRVVGICFLKRVHICTSCVCMVVLAIADELCHMQSHVRVVWIFFLNRAYTSCTHVASHAICMRATRASSSSSSREKVLK